MPNHPNAHSNGCVYEHVLKAEEKIGRYLTKYEVVHHIDKNRSNNNLDNLLIFRTSSDHNRFHKTGTYCLDEFGIAYSVKEVGACIDCGKTLYSKRNKRCVDCYNKMKSYNSNIPSKDILYSLIYSHSMCEIGRMYGVSDATIRKWCRKYELPYKYSDLHNEI